MVPLTKGDDVGVAVENEFPNESKIQVLDRTIVLRDVDGGSIVEPLGRPGRIMPPSFRIQLQ